MKSTHLTMLCKRLSHLLSLIHALVTRILAAIPNSAFYITKTGSMRMPFVIWSLLPLPLFVHFESRVQLKA